MWALPFYLPSILYFKTT
uniref:Uncharacterized protein n=1 Tax=Anguilla anguilla TaxID=7936 RepID=A0A0E9UFN9_ANGAN